MSPETLITPEQERFLVEEIFVAGNRGPCGGVNMALEAAYQVLDLRDQYAGSAVEEDRPEDIDPKYRIYTNWDIVNNVPIMRELSRRGLISVNNNWDLAPPGSVVFFSAHGVPPGFHKTAKERNYTVVDTTCQLVTRVHRLVTKAEKEGKHIVYIGVAGHPETIGVTGELRPESVTLIEKPEGVASLELSAGVKRVVYSQTTLSPREVKDIEDALLFKDPDIEIPNRLDICYATSNRQEAVTKLIEVNNINMLIVVGSRHSHNSTELRNLGELARIPSYLVDFPQDMNIGWFAPTIKKVGVTSGASVLDRFMIPVVEWISMRSPMAKILYEEQVVPEKDMTFKLPEGDIQALARTWI